jgi:hypothetical protein
VPRNKEDDVVMITQQQWSGIQTLINAAQTWSSAEPCQVTLGFQNGKLSNYGVVYALEPLAGTASPGQNPYHGATGAASGMGAIGTTVANAPPAIGTGGVTSTSTATARPRRPGRPRTRGTALPGAPIRSYEMLTGGQQSVVNYIATHPGANRDAIVQGCTAQYNLRPNNCGRFLTDLQKFGWIKEERGHFNLTVNLPQLQGQAQQPQAAVA